MNTKFKLGFSYGFTGVGLDVEYSSEPAESSNTQPVLLQAVPVQRHSSPSLALQPAQPLALQPAQPLALQQAQPLALQQAQPLALQPAQPLALQPAQPLALQPAQPLANTAEYSSNSQVLAFYRNEIPTQPNGAHIETILQEWFGDYVKLDVFHNYIQCLFPNRQQGTNPRAPILTDKDVQEICFSSILKDRAWRAFIMMLNFYGMEMQDSSTITLASNHRERLQKISSVKYYLVISRILLFLKEMKEKQLIKVWLKFLANLIAEGKLDFEARESYNKYWIYTLDQSDMNEVREYIRQISR